MIRLTLKDSGTPLGTISEDDLLIMSVEMEEEHAEDTDYFVAPSTIDLLEASGVSAGTISLLRQAVGTSDGVEITWARESQS